MSTVCLLQTLLGHKAWATAELLDAVEKLDDVQQHDARHTALRRIQHCHVVDQIFAAHLVGAAHKFSDDNLPTTSSPQELRTAMTALDRWYLAYVEGLTQQSLRQSISFTFTDGERGLMSREEMLIHVATHSSYHRGEVGQLLAQCSISPPWDTLAVYLHSTQPLRRLQKQPSLTPSRNPACASP